MPRENNRVIIRIWNPIDTCGHVSVETSDPQQYYSLWPILPKKQLLSIFKGVPHEFKENYEADIAEDAEDREANVVICLYTLNAYDMRTRARELKKELTGWAMKGTEKAPSCASFAYQILKAGGLGRLSNLKGLSTSKAISSMTPVCVRKLVKEARHAERQDSDIREFKYASETPVEPENTGGCLVM